MPNRCHKNLIDNFPFKEKKMIASGCIAFNEDYDYNYYDFLRHLHWWTHSILFNNRKYIEFYVNIRKHIEFYLTIRMVTFPDSGWSLFGWTEKRRAVRQKVHLNKVGTKNTILKMFFNSSITFNNLELSSIIFIISWKKWKHKKTCARFLSKPIRTNPYFIFVTTISTTDWSCKKNQSSVKFYNGYAKETGLISNKMFSFTEYLRQHSCRRTGLIVQHRI